MDADLDDPAARLGGLDHATPLMDGEREGLLHIDVLAGIARVDHHQRVPMVRG